VNAVVIALAVVAIILLMIGGFVGSLKYFLAIGIAVAVIAVVAWALRVLLSRRS
jgi:threonine/homoserine efflux transporter RhtA